MTKGRRPRDLSGQMTAMILTVGVCLFFAALPVTGLKDRPEGIVGKYGQYTPLLPDEVIVYEHADYIGKYRFFRVLPGMRQKLVPDLESMNFNDVISSIQIGSEVGVMVFEHGTFRDYFYGKSLGYDANPAHRVYTESQRALPEEMNDNISSLIVFRKAVEPLGAMLYDEHEKGRRGYYQFFPLPEMESDIEAKYPTLGPMDDDANQVFLWPRDTKSPGWGKVQVTLCESPDYRGKPIILPGADGIIPASFVLGNYSFDDTASSLIVRWVGPLLVQPSLQAPSTSTRVSAPPAPDTAQTPSDKTPAPPAAEAKKPPLDKTQTIPPPAMATGTGISGQWNSNIGAVYEIQQTGNNFTWSVPSLNQSGTGTIAGTSVTMSGPGWTVKGTITETDASGRPTKIVGENNVILFRAAAGPAVPAPSPAQPPIPSPSPAPAVAVNTLTGQWNSNIGAVYEIQQSGNNFTWSAPSLNQSGTGTVSGNIVTMSGPGWTVKGTITETDASGRPTKIVGENNVILFRAAAGPAVQAPSPAQPPIPSPSPAPVVAVNTLTGQWNSNIGAVYEIQQSGNTFTWSAPSLNQSGTGTISGNMVTMSGPGWTVKGIITEADSSGRPTKIVGENGVVLFRSSSGKG